jgi:hypothetical protein
MKVKGWQIAVIVIGFVVAIASITYSLSGPGEPQLPHRYYLIDVETGDIFDVDSKKYLLAIPATNPATQKVSMLRVRKDEDGTWRVFERDLALFSALDKSVKVNAVDRDSGEVLGTVKDPVPFKR